MNQEEESETFLVPNISEETSNLYNISDIHMHIYIYPGVHIIHIKSINNFFNNGNEHGTILIFVLTF